MSNPRGTPSTTETARPATNTESEVQVALKSVPSPHRRQNAATVSWNGERKIREVNIPQISHTSKSEATETTRIARSRRFARRRTSASRIAAAVTESATSSPVSLQRSALEIGQQAVNRDSHHGKNDRRSKHFRHLIGTRCGMQDTAQS